MVWNSNIENNYTEEEKYWSINEKEGIPNKWSKNTANTLSSDNEE